MLGFDYDYDGRPIQLWALLLVRIHIPCGCGRLSYLAEGAR